MSPIQVQAIELIQVLAAIQLFDTFLDGKQRLYFVAKVLKT